MQSALCAVVPCLLEPSQLVRAAHQPEHRAGGHGKVAGTREKRVYAAPHEHVRNTRGRRVLVEPGAAGVGAERLLLRLFPVAAGCGRCRHAVGRKTRAGRRRADRGCRHAAGPGRRQVEPLGTVRSKSGCRRRIGRGLPFHPHADRAVVPSPRAHAPDDAHLQRGAGGMRARPRLVGRAHTLRVPRRMAGRLLPHRGTGVRVVRVLGRAGVRDSRRPPLHWRGGVTNHHGWRRQAQGEGPHPVARDHSLVPVLHTVLGSPVQQLGLLPAADPRPNLPASGAAHGNRRERRCVGTAVRDVHAARTASCLCRGPASHIRHTAHHPPQEDRKLYCVVRSSRVPVGGAVPGLPSCAHRRASGVEHGAQRAHAVRLQGHPHRHESGVRRRTDVRHQHLCQLGRDDGPSVRRKDPRGLQRYTVSLLSFLSLTILFSICTNLSICMVAMVKPPPDDDDAAPLLCPQLAGGEEVEGAEPAQDGEFSWHPGEQGWVLGAFFWGYLPSSMLAGAGAAAWGGRRVLGGGVLAAGTFTLITPLAARLGPTALFADRMLVGLGAGVCLPSVHTLIGQWIPERERSVASTLIYNGITTGNVLTLTLAGRLIEAGGGWPAVFYVTGGAACLWCVAWALLVAEGPSSTGHVGLRWSIPWRAICVSCPFHALCWTHFCNNWGFSTLLSFVPTYLAQVTHLHIAQNGLLSSIPYAASFLFASASCVAVDWARSRRLLSVTALRKIANSIAFFLPGACLVAVPFLGCSPAPIVTLLALTSGFNGFKLSGFCVTHVDMSPRHAGILMSGTSTFGNLAGVLAPLYAGTIQKENLKMFLENQIFSDNSINDERISRAIDNDHTAAMKVPSESKKHKKKGTSSDMITVCMLCQKAFKSPAFYRKHLRIHSDKARRHKHKRLKHTFQQQQQHATGGEEARPYACQLCPKSFCIKSSLQRHLSCHTGEKPFVCGLCQRGYTRRSVLALHVQQVHEARKPFQCDSCQLRFSQKGNLQAHFRRKHLPPVAQQQGKGNKRGGKRILEQKRLANHEQKINSTIHSYASKVKAIVSRGQMSNEKAKAIVNRGQFSHSQEQKARVVNGREIFNGHQQQKAKAIVHREISYDQQPKGKVVNSPEQPRSIHSYISKVSREQISNDQQKAKAIVSREISNGQQQRARMVNSPEQPKASIHSYASKVKAIVSRGGQQKRVRYPDPPAPPSLSSLGGSSEGEGCSSESEGGFMPAPLPDLESFLVEGGRWEEFLLADTLLTPPYEALLPKGGEVLGGWTDDCPLFTAEDLDEIKEISGNIYGMDIKVEPLSEMDRFYKPHTKGLA